MRRSDRLSDIVEIVRDGRLHLARDIASALGVSARTVYRHIDTLVASGVPIEGERGVGYLLREPVFLPPMTLSIVELEALHLGMAMVGEAADEELQAAAATLLAKVAETASNRRRARTDWGFGVYPLAQARLGFRHMPTIRAAIREGTVLRSITCRWMTGAARGRSGLSRRNTGAGSGRWAAGANCVATSACSGSTGCRPARPPAGGSDPSRARRWRII